MQTAETLSALRAVTLALEDVQGAGWVLPHSDDPDDGPQPQTFLELTKQFSGDRVPEGALVTVIDALAPLCPELDLKWK
ncbi:hypothetical protein NPS53_09095 [Pseudomonas putida]|uniref:hypothetical protein n=1 Tax=Pseudomonas putida TaxID=303 RepID=UPI00236466B8|nr:hypothetical protein [Pseudomonas putida]MDD2139731.1 hypothetical protein [Pseudomonas putida]HDS1721655.1 hypothetical protein [Pseudomonas putida]